MADREKIEAEIAKYERWAEKRRGTPGFGQNVVDIERRLEELRAELKGDA